MDDFKELYTPDASTIGEKTVQSMSRQMGHRNFASEQEARDWLFDTLEHWDKQSWSHIFGVDGPAKNRWFADNFPVYQNRWGHWRLGRPLGTWAKEKRHQAYLARKATEDAEEKGREAQFKRDYPGWHYYPKLRRRKVQEYLSNMTSDFSDGTSGGDPVSRPPSTGDFGTSAGLPDYKYIERTHADKKERLRKLLARRDPGGVSTNPHDVALRRSLGDSVEGEEGLGKELASKPLVFRPQAEGPGRREHFLVELPDGSFLGVVFFDDLSPKQKTIPTLRRLWTEFPWISISRQNSEPQRHRTKEDAVARVANWPAVPTDQGAASKRQMEIHAEEKAKMQEGEESFKDVFFTSKPIGWVSRWNSGPSKGKYFGWNTERNSEWTPYIGDARIFKRKSTWLKWECAKLGEWDILPIYHDPRKYGDRALDPEPPRRLLSYPKPPPPDQDLPFAEAMEDNRVKDVSGLTFWHGARVGREFGKPGDDGLIFVSTDKDYASTFIDPLELHSEEDRGKHLAAVRVTNLRNPKVFNMQNDAEFEAFTQRGISAESLAEGGHDGAMLLDGDHVVDVAVINPEQLSFEQVQEAMEDNLVKDVAGPVDLTLDDFAKNYKAVPFGGYARNTFHKYIFTKRLHVNAKWSQAFPNGGGHVWTLIRFKQDPERLLVMVPTSAPEFPGHPYDVIGYALTEEPGVPDSSIAIVNHEVLNQV